MYWSTIEWSKSLTIQTMFETIDHPSRTHAFPTIRTLKASDLLAAELRQRILQGSLADGSTLPSERDLMDQTGVSRSAVREALRILQVEGLVETRTGRFGGSVVRRPSDEALANYLGLFIQGRAIPLISLLEFREVIGGPLAALAATNRTEEDIAALQLVGQSQEAALHDVPVYLAENVRWQIAMAAATHNELITAFVTAISGLIFKATAMRNVASEQVRISVVQSHKSILAAVIAQDAEEARRRMKRHLEEITSAMLALTAGPRAVL